MPKPIRVCMRVDNVFTSDLRVRKEAEALAEAGYDVMVVADMKPGQGLAEREERNGVRIRRIGKSSRIPYQSIIRPLLEERADIYHAHDIDSLFPCLAAARLGGQRARVVYDSHELWSAHAKDKIHAKRRLLVHFEGQMLHAADALITASPECADVILGKYQFSGIAQTILNVPVYRSDEQLAAHWAKRGADGLIRVVAVGVFQHGRGAVPLIQSLAHLPSHYVIELIGPIPQPEYESLMRAAAEPFGDRVRFVGAIPPDDIVPRLAESDISAVLIEPISLSYHLAAPNKLFDSLMAGAPIVASNMPFIDKVVSSEQAGVICDVTDPVDIARAVELARASAETFGRAGRQAALRYNWDREKEKLLELYRALEERIPGSAGAITR